MSLGMLDIQPLHTMYGGAHRFKADSAAKLRGIALATFERYRPQAEALAADLAGEGAAQVVERVATRLASNRSVEDFRVDFEDGFGVRSDTEEDAAAVAVAGEFGRGMAEGSLPPRIGIRIKSLSGPYRGRGLRTLDRFLRRLGSVSGKLPPGFVVTLPKVTRVQEVTELTAILTQMERALGLPPVGLELMIESPLALMDETGRCPLRALVEAGGGRVRGAHFGAYDLLSALAVPGSQHSLAHPSCEHARQTMLIALRGTGVWLSDGAFLELPLPRHAEPTPEQAEENAAVVLHAWRGHARAVTHALETSFHQGWDLHPNQLISRYVATCAFYRRDAETTARRLAALLGSASQAVSTQGAFDDAASGRGLAGFLRRGLVYGAIDDAELAGWGIDPAELRVTPFDGLVQARTKPLW